MEINPKLLRFNEVPPYTQIQNLIPNTVVQGQVKRIIKDGKGVHEIQVSVNKILAVAHSGRELYLPHKRDEVFYEGEIIVIPRLGWQCD